MYQPKWHYIRFARMMTREKRVWTDPESNARHQQIGTLLQRPCILPRHHMSLFLGLVNSKKKKNQKKKKVDYELCSARNTVLGLSRGKPPTSTLKKKTS